ncbi:hypothetical protein [Algicola sagamiensis]|uniref:hypothetical protein n=1 Tax=Algicola sagamiensis TaxID=163869 RepID=UPI0003A0B0D5|nr:hypothetical protein [Algicola sagamiensis]
MGCSTAKWLGSYVGLYSENDLETILVQSENMTNPIAYDVVFIYDETLTNTLTEFSGPQWFIQKDEVLLKYGQSLSVISNDVVKNMPPTPLTLPSNAQDAKAILLFANYPEKQGQTVAILSGYEALKVLFKQGAYEIKGGDE